MCGVFTNRIIMNVGGERSFRDELTSESESRVWASFVFYSLAQSGPPDLVRHGDIIRLEHKEYVPPMKSITNQCNFPIYEMTKEPLTHSVNALEQGLSTGGPQAVSGPLNCKTRSPTGLQNCQDQRENIAWSSLLKQLKKQKQLKLK